MLQLLSLSLSDDSRSLNNMSIITLIHFIYHVEKKLNMLFYFIIFFFQKTKQYYLQEIRICFDKNLVLTNCDGVRVRQQFHWVPLGNCPNDKPILYPNSVPSPSRKPLPPPPDTSIVSLLKSVQFLMWLTS